LKILAALNGASLLRRVRKAFLASRPCNARSHAAEINPLRFSAGNGQPIVPGLDGGGWPRYAAGGARPWPNSNAATSTKTIAFANDDVADPSYRSITLAKDAVHP
jgi:hypothetical protein